jgi:2-polyprenyl-3-methyl-5-hydroxy-6-metoxy-1,4-benzoquinol methylase
MGQEYPDTPIETVKAYWDARPCNIRHSKKPVGTKEYFDEVEQRKYFVEPHIPGFAQFERWKGKKVLEIGCGIGTDTINFARAGAAVSAIDLSRESVAIARKRAEVFGLTGQIRFYDGNAEELPSIVPVQHYDLVYSFGVIHHTPNPDRVIENLKQYMNADSELRIMMYAKNSWKTIMIEAGIDQPEAQSGCPIAYTLSHDELRALLKDFRILSMEQGHIFPFVIEKYVKHEYEVMPWFAAMPREMFRTLEKRLGWHTLIVAMLAPGAPPPKTAHAPRTTFR